MGEEAGKQNMPSMINRDPSFLSGVSNTRTITRRALAYLDSNGCGLGEGKSRVQDKEDQ